jgi:hypothetical protein
MFSFPGLPGDSSVLGGRWYTFDARHNNPRIGRAAAMRSTSPS